MLSLAQSLFLDSELRVEQELPHVGSALENPFVYDAVAREIKQMAQRGLVEIVEEHKSPAAEPLIRPFRRFVPPLGGLDFSLMFAMIALTLAQILVIAPLNDLAARM